MQYPKLKEREFPGYVHSRHYPFLKKQQWYVMVTDETKQKIVFVQKLILRSSKSDEGRVTNLDKIKEEPLNEAIFELRQRLGRPGQFRFLVSFINDSYMGFDQTVPLHFEIKPDEVGTKI